MTEWVGADRPTFWLESTDDGDIQVGCDCGWLGDAHYLMGQAVREGDEHLAEAHDPT